MRSRTIGALLAVGVGAAAMAPVWAFVAVFVWMMLARSVDRSMTALLRRRLEHGQRPRDLALSAVSSPWHLVLGAVTAIGGLAVPLLVAVTASLRRTVCGSSDSTSGASRTVFCKVRPLRAL